MAFDPPIDDAAPPPSAPDPAGVEVPIEDDELLARVDAAAWKRRLTREEYLAELLFRGLEHHEEQAHPPESTRRPRV
jgi:hypothetical protein